MRARAAGLSLLAAALAAAGAGCGSDPPPRVAAIAPALPAAPLERALSAELARVEVSGGVDPVLERLIAQDGLDERIPVLVRAGVELRDVRLRHAGDEVAAEATVDPAKLRELAPGGIELEYDPGAGGEGIVLEGSAERLGFEIPVSVRVAPVDGAVVARPEGLPIGETTLYDDPRLRVTGLAARPLPGGLVRLRMVGRVAG